LNKIDKNWDLFDHKTKIRTYLIKLDKNWDQKCILTYEKFNNGYGFTRVVFKIYFFKIILHYNESY